MRFFLYEIQNYEDEMISCIVNTDSIFGTPLLSLVLQILIFQN